MLIVLVAPLLMFLATAVERRYGPAAAGWVGAAPATIALVAIGAGTDVAVHAGAHVVAQVAFFVAFAEVVARRGPAAGLAAGTAAFTAVSVSVAAVPLWLATAAAVPALLLAPRPSRAVAATGGGAAIPALAALAFVSVTLIAALLAGAAAAGTLAAFPALSTVLAWTIARRGGRVAAAAALHGAIGGLRGYLAFCVTAPVLGVTGALAVCAAVTLAAAGARPAGGASVGPTIMVAPAPRARVRVTPHARSCL